MLSFEGAIIWKLAIDCTGPITEGIDVLPVESRGQPFLTARPADGFAGTEIDHMRAATESIEARPGAGQGVLSRVPDYAARPPAAGKHQLPI